MRLFATFLSCCLLTGITFAGRPTPLALAERGDLASALGGACENCADDDSVTCTGTVCTKIKDGEYEEKTGTLITPQKCAAAAKGAGGFTACNLTVNKPCFTYQTCTDIEVDYCENCSAKQAPNGNDKPTKCSTSGGYRCTGS